VSYTLLVNGGASALVVTMLITASDGSDLAHSVPVAAGDLVTIQVAKSASATGDIDDVMYSVLFT